MAPELNYFTCTLGQAAQWKQTVPKAQQSFSSVLDLVDKQADAIGDHFALGFANLRQEHAVTLTFRRLCDLSVQAVGVLEEALGPRKAGSSSTIGLICSSGLNFILTWLGLMRLGYTVFLLAPQLDHRGLKHLCKTTSASTIFVDENHYETFKEVQDDTLSLVKVPSFSREIGKGQAPKSAAQRKNQADTAYLRHTSGTSSGLPKPIEQSQLGAVGVLASLPPSKNPIATFSTTPLYHGGLADSFRSWSCGAPIWFFPEDQGPISCANILKAVRSARHNSSSSGGSGGSSGEDSVRYFSSVPYVLQMLSEEPDGIDMLGTMDLVGVGGAALPAVIGDKLVDHGVRLVSRMGSAECGFLLSSDRDYDADKEWQYLRCAVDDPDILAFEPQDGSDLCELVAKPKWPLRNKTNRDDGSFATSDLFQRHASIANAWKYHSRSDAQITLANGKKFDPAPLEDAIRVALSKVLEDVLVFGAGREYPGAILFGKALDDTEDDILSAAWPAIDSLNKNSSAQARLSRSALICVVPQETSDTAKKPLQKSSKGTLLRKQAEERYGELIESTYSPTLSSSGESQNVLDEDLPAVLLKEFQNVLGQPVDGNEDLFQQGVDSMACIQLRRMISSNFLPKGQPLSLNVIYDCGSVKALAAHIVKIKSGKETHGSGAGSDEASELSIMEQLVQKYGNDSGSRTNIGARNPDAQQSSHGLGDIILLTGATGLLGAHILEILAQDTKIRKIFCLVRGQSKHASEERVRKALDFRGLKSWDAHGRSKIICLPAKLTEPCLGLDDADFAEIMGETTIIIHGAWTVNFSLRLRSFENQIAGTKNLLDLASATSARARLYFISSTASVGSVSGSDRISESLSTDPADASPIGYAQSKWVAERVCASYEPPDESSRPKITIIRIGQLCGSTNSGVWNASEAYPLMLSTSSITSSLPRLPNQGLNWLPVDQAAAAVVEIATVQATSTEDEDEKNVQVYHVLQPHLRPTWDEMLKWLSESDIGAAFTVVPPEKWLDKLNIALSGPGEAKYTDSSNDKAGGDKTQQQVQHPSSSLLSFWQDRYGSGAGARGAKQKASLDETSAGFYLLQGGQEQKDYGGDEDGNCGDELNEPLAQMSRFDVEKARRVSSVMREVKPLTRDEVLAMWRWICENVGV
ncbi:ribosome biogenesis protein SSF1/2 [Microdochium nivale]|nr:ribosome biogenesis protein SSF1/2 [Microdochium nivale]